jgi:hypothetical protein
MTTLGTLTILNSAGSTVYTMGFFNIEFPDGWPYDVEQNTVEPLTAMGVNNERMRIIRTDFKRFRMQAFSEAATFTAAVALGVAFQAYKGFVCQLAFTTGGNAYTYTDNLYLWDLTPVPRPCQLASTIASDASLGLLDTIFELQFVN